MKRYILLMMAPFLMFTGNTWANELSVMQTLVYNLPDSVALITHSEALDPFFNSGSVLDRCRGIYRLGQIGNTHDINTLIDIYNNTPFRDGYSVDRSEGPQYFAIKAIADIGGVKAESSILALGNQLWGCSKTDSLIIIRAMAEALRKLGTTSCRELLLKYSTDTSFRSPARINALMNLYLLDLNNPLLKSMADSIDFLYSNLPKTDSISVKDKENYIKYKALSYVLLNPVFCNSNSISYFRSKINEVSEYPELYGRLQSIAEKMEYYYSLPNK